MIKDTYVIKKFGNGIRAIPAYFGFLVPILYIVMPIIMFIVMYNLEYKEGNFDEDAIWIALFGIMLIVYGVILLREVNKLKKVRNYKFNGGGMVKKAKVISINKTRANKGGRGNYVDVYYIEAEDSGMVYYSNGNTKGKLSGTSLDELKLLYGMYGFTFNENHDQKDDVLRKIDQSIAEKEYEVENASFISKIKRGKELSKLKEDREIVSYGYIAPYREIDDKKVTVGDMVDVYFDPDKPERYWVDTDFLFGD